MVCFNFGQAKTDEALVTCRKALAMSENQRETQHICLYEIGNHQIFYILIDAYLEIEIK